MPKDYPNNQRNLNNVDVFTNSDTSCHWLTACWKTNVRVKFLFCFLFPIASAWKDVFKVAKNITPTLVRKTLSSWRGEFADVSLTECAELQAHTEAVESSHYDLHDRAKRNAETAVKVCSFRPLVASGVYHFMKNTQKCILWINWTKPTAAFLSLYHYAQIWRNLDDPKIIERIRNRESRGGPIRVRSVINF